MWQAWKHSTRRALVISYHGFRLPCYPDSRQASSAIYFNGWPDFWEMRFVADYLKSGDCFLDVGANIGLYSLLAASVVGYGGRIIAFEPGQVPERRIRETCAKNRLENVQIIGSAVGERTGEIPFDAGNEDAISHVAAAGETFDSRVPVTRLDDFLDGSPIAMAKLDIEGYEPFALRGMSRHLADGNPPVLLIEAAGYSKRYGIETHDFMREIERWNYQPMIYDPGKRELIRADSHWKLGVTNVLCVCREAHGFVEKRIAHAGEKAKFPS